jgi:hypothetical protein
MPFTMPNGWQRMPTVHQGVEPPRTVYYDGELYVSIRDLRHVINHRQKRVTSAAYASAMKWMRDLLKQLLEDET